jgi:hypothetical protein
MSSSRRQFLKTLGLAGFAGYGLSARILAPSGSLVLQAPNGLPAFEVIPGSASGITFERTSARSPQFYLPETLGDGGGFIDYDNDGWMDIFLTDVDEEMFSLYHVLNAHGLATLSANQSAVDGLRSAGQTSRDQGAKVGNEPVSAGEARLMDSIVQSTRSNYQLTLAHLAESTGGILIANTNDLRAPIRRLAEDIQSYYPEFPFSAPIQGQCIPVPAPRQSSLGSFGMAGSPMLCMEYLCHLPAPRALENCRRELTS